MPSPWERRAQFAALSAWLVASLFMALSAFALFGEDFRDFYAAARVLLAGGDVYDHREVAAMMRAVAGFSRHNPFYYPPWFAYLLAPFALLPYWAARAAWMALNVGLWAAGLAALSEVAGWPPRGADGPRPDFWRWGGRWLVYLMATFLFAWVTWRYEQLGVWLFALFAGALWALARGHRRLCGVLLALMLTKPTVAILPVAAVLLWLARRRMWAPVIAFGLTVLLLIAVSAPLLPLYARRLADPDFGRGLAYVLTESGGIKEIRINTTLRDWLAAFGVPPAGVTAAYVLSALVGLGALAVVVWRANSALTVAAVAVVVGYWLAPYALQYDFPPLTVSLFWVLRDMRRQTDRLRRLSLILLLGILSVLFWERPISDGFWIVIGLTAMLALAAHARRAWPGRARQPARGDI